MEQFVRCHEKICSFPQVQPHQPVPFEGKAIWAQRIGAGIYTAIWQKFPERFFTDIAGVIRPTVEDHHYLEHNMAEQLQILPWDFPDNKTDKRLHDCKNTKIGPAGMFGIGKS
jgi:hypothetical protein